MRQKFMLINYNNGVKGMLIKIPDENKRIWDISENRWGFRFHSKI